MSKFCTNCGRPLDEGAICNCLKMQAEEEMTFNSGNLSAQSGTFTQQNDFKQFFESMWSIVKMFAKNPIDTIVNTAKTDDIKVGLFFVGVQALIASLTAIILVNRISSSIFGLLFGTMSLFGSRFDISYFSIFIKVILAVAVQYFLLIGLFYLGSKFIAKKTGSVKTLMATLGISTIPMTASLLVSLVVGLIVPMVIFYIMIFGIVCSIMLNYISLRESYEISENKAAYIVPLSYLVYFFLILGVFT
mgnify:CR=1 FL=1